MYFLQNTSKFCAPRVVLLRFSLYFLQNTSKFCAPRVVFTKDSFVFLQNTSKPYAPRVDFTKDSLVKYNNLHENRRYLILLVSACESQACRRLIIVSMSLLSDLNKFSKDFELPEPRAPILYHMETLVRGTTTD